MQRHSDRRTYPNSAPIENDPMTRKKKRARSSSSSSSSSWASSSAVNPDNGNGHLKEKSYKLRASKSRTGKRKQVSKKRQNSPSSSSSSSETDPISNRDHKTSENGTYWGLTVKPQPPPSMDIPTYQQVPSMPYCNFGVRPPPPPPPPPVPMRNSQPSCSTSSLTASTSSGSSHAVHQTHVAYPQQEQYDYNLNHHPLPGRIVEVPPPVGLPPKSLPKDARSAQLSGRRPEQKPPQNSVALNCSVKACSSTGPQSLRPTVIGKKCLPRISEGWGVGSILNYEIVTQVGEGTYGQVYKAVERKSRRMVALKKVRLENEKEGFPITAVREIKILRQLDHPNIVKLLDIVTENDLKSDTSAFYLVFEYVDHDLMGLLESQMITLTEMQIASFMKQLLLALDYSHSHNFLHRDLKCSNILISNSGQLKLADFGLARFYHENHHRLYTNRVITLWYRPPELLLGEERYGPAVDIWSVGCILAELFVRKPIFQGTSDLTQLELICQMCGTPSASNWPDVENLSQYEVMRPRRPHPRVLREHFSFMPALTIDLLDRMLTLAPERRVTAGEALRHAWLLNVNPALVVPPELPRNQDCHEMWCKNQKRRRMQAV